MIIKKGPYERADVAVSDYKIIVKGLGRIGTWRDKVVTIDVFIKYFFGSNEPFKAESEQEIVDGILKLLNGNKQSTGPCGC